MLRRWWRYAEALRSSTVGGRWGGRELLRRLLQNNLDLRALREPRLAEVIDAEQIVHRAVEAGHQRPLATVFGTVGVSRRAYRHRGHANLYPGDGQLNLPVERHSHGLRRLAAIEASRGSFEQAAEVIGRASGQQIGKWQVETLTPAPPSTSRSCTRLDGSKRPMIVTCW